MCPPDDTLFCPSAYNELVLDCWQGGAWDLPNYVWAIGISHNATQVASSLAQEVYEAALSNAVRVPFVRYNRHAESTPFTLIQKLAPPPPHPLPPPAPPGQ